MKNEKLRNEKLRNETYLIFYLVYLVNLVKNKSVSSAKICVPKMIHLRYLRYLLSSAKICVPKMQYKGKVFLVKKITLPLAKIVLPHFLPPYFPPKSQNLPNSPFAKSAVANQELPALHTRLFFAKPNISPNTPARSALA